MMNTTLEKLRYPIGQFQCPKTITDQHIKNWIFTLEHFPSIFEALVKNLTNTQLDTPYRPGGWTIRQVIHHVADSHHHSYIRFKWALTETKPTIKAYNEAAWAELFDSKTAPITISLMHLKAVHAKLVYFLKGLNRQDLNTSFIHPETQSEVLLSYNIGNYAWHGNHHYTHIEHALKQNNWM